MKNLPQIKPSVLKYGISPLSKRTRKVKEFSTDRKTKWQIVGFDSESYLDMFFKHKLLSAQIVSKLGGDIDRHFLLNPKRNVELLTTFPKKCYIFAHNLQFDLSNLIGNDAIHEINELTGKDTYHGWTGFALFGVMGLAHFKNKETGHDLMFIDTMNFFKGSLKNVAKMWLPSHMHKLPRPNYLGDRPPDKSELDYFIKYSIRDAEICYWLGTLIYESFMKINIPIQYTPAGKSAVDFRTNFLKNNMLLPSSEYINFIWRCYQGARFESYGRGYFHSGRNSQHKNMGELKMYDINSLYPYAMIQPLPFHSIRKIKTYTVEEWEKDRDKIIGWVKCFGKYTDKVIYPQMPHFTTKMFYPLNFESYATTYEFKQCIDDIDINKSLICGFIPEKEDLNHPIKKYVEHYYKEKQKLDEIKKQDGKLTESQWQERYNIKLSLNSLYGKFAERHYDEKSLLWKSGKLFNPAISSLITGFARAEISKAVKKYDALYCDTDSCLTYRKIPTSEKLGDFKLECVGDALLIRPKLYFIFPSNDKLDLKIKENFAHLSTQPAKKYNMPIKYGKHGFRLHPKNVLKTFEWNYGNSDIFYSIDKISKFRESLRRKLPTLSKIKFNSTVGLNSDNKRVYNKELSTIQHLSEDNSLSCAIPRAVIK